MRPKRSPEAELLLAIASPRVKKPRLGKGVDKQAFLKLAARHKLLPLAQKRLGLKPDLPQRMRNMLLVSELVRLGKIFRAARLPFIAIKGPALSIAAYGNPYLRQSLDLDFIVRKKDLAAYRRLLVKNGYRFYKTLAHHGETGYRLAKAPKRLKFLVELHWTMDVSFWKNVAALSLNGENIPVLSDENGFRLICENAEKDGWNTLSPCADLAWFAARRKPDVRHILKKAKGTPAYDAITNGLLLAKILLGARF